ncbi:hypothetical protein [Streptosporangium sp. LJ11]
MSSPAPVSSPVPSAAAEAPGLAAAARLLVSTVWLLAGARP